MGPVVPVPVVSDGVTFEELRAKRTLRGSGWMEAIGALVRKESLRDSGCQKSGSRQMPTEATYKVSA